jgi:hypothetical protein
MSKKRKGSVPIRRVGMYSRAKIGYAAKNNVSMYTVACKALALDGRPKPANVKEKDWVIQNIDFILSQPGKARPKSTSVKVTNADKNHPYASSEFLNTYEWRRVRMQALKKYGPKCMCCGATPANGAVMNVDHIKPRRFYPELALDVDNLQILCHDCNHGKGNWDMTDWRPDADYKEAVDTYTIILPNI